MDGIELNLMGTISDIVHRQAVITSSNSQTKPKVRPADYGDGREWENEIIITIHTQVKQRDVQADTVLT